VAPHPRRAAKKSRPDAPVQVYTSCIYSGDADEIVVKRTASGVSLMPKKITMEQPDAVLGQFCGRFVRRQPPPQKRRWRRSGYRRSRTGRSPERELKRLVEPTSGRSR
jgi:hypothetical protein